MHTKKYAHLCPNLPCSSANRRASLPSSILRGHTMEVEEGEGVRRWRRFPVSPHTISSFRRVMKSSSFKPSSREFCSNYRQVDINSSAPNPNILQLYVLIAQKTSKSSIDNFKNTSPRNFELSAKKKYTWTPQAVCFNWSMQTPYNRAVKFKFQLQ